jgi:hypothetical protein
LTELGVDFIARQVPEQRKDRSAMRARAGVDEMPVLIAGEEVLIGPEQILPFLDRHHQRTPNSERHRARDLDPETLHEREEARAEFP